MFINSIMATSTSIKINSVMATFTLIKGRRQLSWKKVQTRLGLIVVHVDQSSILRAELTKTCRTVQNAERHLCNVADDVRPVESRRANQNHILIAVVARELHADKLTFWVLDGFTTLKYTYPHLCRSTVRRLMGKCAAEKCVIGLIISARSGSERPVVDM